MQTIWSGRVLSTTAEYDSTATQLTAAAWTGQLNFTGTVVPSTISGRDTFILHYLVSNTNLGASVSTSGLSESGKLTFTTLAGLSSVNIQLSSASLAQTGQYLYIWLEHDVTLTTYTINLNITASSIAVLDGSTLQWSNSDTEKTYTIACTDNPPTLAWVATS